MGQSGSAACSPRPHPRVPVLVARSMLMAGLLPLCTKQTTPTRSAPDALAHITHDHPLLEAYASQDHCQVCHTPQGVVVLKVEPSA